MNISQQVESSVSPSFREYTPKQTMKAMQTASPRNYNACDRMEKLQTDKPYCGKSKMKKATVHKKDKRGKKKWKKPKGKPNRPLSAYNLFFRYQRAAMLGDDIPSPMMEILKKRVHCKTHGKIGFAEMAREIGRRWKALEPENKKEYEDKAKEERQRYDIELSKWKESLRLKEGTSALDTLSNAAMSVSDTESISCEKSVDSTLDDPQCGNRREIASEEGMKYVRSNQVRPLSPPSMSNLAHAPTPPGSSSYYDRITVGTSIPMSSRLPVLPRDSFVLQHMVMNPAPGFGGRPSLHEQILSGSISPTASGLAFLAQTEYHRQQMIAALFQR